MATNAQVAKEDSSEAAALAAKVRAEFEARIEEVKSPEMVELELPGGTTVVMGPPRGASMLRAVTIMGEVSARSGGTGGSAVALGWIKSLLYVRSIDGVAVTNASTLIELQRIADRLGDRGEEIVMTAYAEYWPPFTPSQLDSIKK